MYIHLKFYKLPIIIVDFFLYVSGVCFLRYHKKYKSLPTFPKDIQPEIIQSLQIFPRYFNIWGKTSVLCDWIWFAVASLFLSLRDQ